MVNDLKTLLKVFSLASSSIGHSGPSSAYGYAWGTAQHKRAKARRRGCR